MKAIVQDKYGPVEALELRDIDRPEIGADEVLVEVRAAGVEPGVWHLMTGLPYVMRVMGFGFRGPKSPVLGRDVSGLVEAIGKDVTRFKPGDEVFGTCEGSFAEFASASESQLALKPVNVGFEEAAVLPISGITALQAVRDKGQVLPGDKVLIIGAGGGVGTFAVQIAKAFGAEVTGVCSTSKVDLVASLGADRVIDYTREDIADGTVYDVIIDNAGNRPLSSLRSVLHPEGRLVIVGGEEGGNWVGPLDRIVPAVLIGPFVKQKMGMLMSKENTPDLLELAKLVESGKVRPVVERTFPLVDAPDAVRHIGEGHARGKVVVTI